ncbi:MAG: FkbM family methyltransferase, partial [Nitrosomonas sp.]|nr:FkbM family methyltransferase [Nitrosomonas sp.]
MTFKPAQILHSCKSETDVCQESYLRDHAFRGLAILPGAFYIDKLAKLAKDSLGNLPDRIYQISFEKVFIIPETGPAVLTCELRETPEGGFIGLCQSQVGVHAKARIEFNEKNPGIVSHALHEGNLHLRSNTQKINGDQFYSSIKASGNEYGKAFQGISELWSSDGKAFAIVSGQENSKSLTKFLSPALLDASLQVLPAANNKTGRTFVLTSIGSLHFFGDLLGDAHVFAEIENNDSAADTFRGKLTITNEDGGLVLFLNDVTFQYLEDETLKSKIVVSSTFTSEPMLEALQFWSKQLAQNWEVQFAPYNQVYQQLLDPSSLVGSNSNGINVVLFRLEDWFRFQKNLAPRLNTEEQIKHFGDAQRYTLPNRLQVAHLNEYETQYLYHEIFKEKTYLKHGITLEDGASVLDIGANIGLFNLFVQTQVKNATIHSFEPSPIAFDCLKKNATLYGSEDNPEDGRCKVKLHSIGISNETKELPFTFYPTSSVFSSYCPDTEEDELAIRRIVRNTVEKSLRTNNELAENEIEAVVDQLMEGRLDIQTYPCQLRPLSDVIREENIKTIDLLKVDVEKAEWDVLCGIEDAHWQIIKQIVIEVHDREGTLLSRVVALLESKGFQLSSIEEEELLTESGLYNIYGRKLSQESAESKLPKPLRSLG